MTALRWDAERLDRFLTDPAEMFPGLWMSIRGVEDAAERAALVRFLRSRLALTMMRFRIMVAPLVGHDLIGKPASTFPDHALPVDALRPLRQ